MDEIGVRVSVNPPFVFLLTLTIAGWHGVAWTAYIAGRTKPEIVTVADAPSAADGVAIGR